MSEQELKAALAIAEARVQDLQDRFEALADEIDEWVDEQEPAAIAWLKRNGVSIVALLVAGIALGRGLGVV